MSEQLQYRVTFSGVLTGEFDEATTRAQFARLFRLTDERTARLFSGREYVLKDNVSESVAMAFAMRIAEAGCECYIEELIKEDTPPEHQQERRQQERRTRTRRPGRPGAGPDRRRVIGRRQSDQPAHARDQQAHH